MLIFRNQTIYRLYCYPSSKEVYLNSSIQYQPIIGVKDEILYDMVNSASIYSGYQLEQVVLDRLEELGITLIPRYSII